MKWSLDTFDSSTLGVSSYKLYPKVPTLPHTSGRGFYSCFTPCDPSMIRSLEVSGFRLISIRNIYRLGDVPSEQKSVGVTIQPFARQLISKQNITELVRPIWEFSRYKRDREIPVRKSLELYQKWGENSLYGGYAQRCFLAIKSKKYIGICTVKVRGDGAYIDLMGVVSGWQGRHIGSALLKHTISYCTKKFKNIFVVTEGENVRANAFYQRNGFRLHDVELVYHKHIV